MKRITRREALKLVVLAGGASLLPIALLRRGLTANVNRARVRPALQAPCIVLPECSKGSSPGSKLTQSLFQVPLPIMPVLKPVRSDSTTDYYEITQKAALVEIIPGHKTTIWGYNGQFPGPTIKGRAKRHTVITQKNELSEKVVVHLHGMPSVPEHDGYALDSILPGKSKDYKYFNDHAATYWYHDHQYMMTARHNYMGLAGMYIVQDEVEDRLPLPKGDYDVPLLIADRTFNSKDYSLCFNPDSDTILVNGAPWPRMEVANCKYRFRILNGSISTAYQLALEPGKQLTKQFTVIGTDAGLMSKPVEVFSLRIGPAERYEVIIDFSKYSIGTKVELQNLLGLTDAGVPDPTFSKIMRFDVVREEKHNTVTPNTLRNDIQLLAPAAASVSSAALRPSAASTSSSPKITFRDFLLDQDSTQKWVINGKGFDPNFFAAEPKLGDTEIWQFRNTSFTDYHLVHLHLVKFTILERRGVSKDVLPDADKNGVLPYEHNPKDTVFLDKRQQNGPETSVKLLVKFEKHTGKYMFHCHVLDHEDCDMMSQFCVKPSDCKFPIPIP